jgi:hypothetical protein
MLAVPLDRPLGASMTPSDQPTVRGVLYAITCAAPPSRDIHVLVDKAQHAGWDVCVIATPTAFRWIDAPALSEQTGHPVRYDYKLPGEPDLLPPPDAIVVAPATMNTLNKWAAGICDSLALGLICEAMGMELPIIVLPYLNAAQAKHPALAESIERLRGCGVQVLYDRPEVPSPHPPRQGKRDQFPWALTLTALEDS